MKKNTLLLNLTILLLVIPPAVFATPLDDYVKAPDASYRYSVVRTLPGSGCTIYVLDMTSQTWRKPGEVDRTTWQHWLTIVKPDAASGNKALLWITGGSNGGSAPSTPDAMLTGIALSTNSVVAELRMVPNQPLVFPDGGGPRHEDAIIAYTFDKYLKTSDPNWPLLLPMVKSAVRAMDTVAAHLASVTGGKTNINQFVVSGGSKRGWTTWLTAAVDKRVIAIIPVVIDVLNMSAQMKHHYSAYGFYAPAIQDYDQLKVFDQLDTPAGRQVRSIVDPYEYRTRYTMPKFIVNSTCDQFFVPDSSQFYYHELTGEKYLRYVPNADHSLSGSDAPTSLILFYKSILTGSPRPQFSWVVKGDNTIVVTTTTTPAAVNLWQATNPNARDFRLETLGRVWTSSPLTKEPDGTYIAKMAAPEKGWTAFFVELIFPGDIGLSWKLTTEVRVVPAKLPYAYKLGFDTDSDVDFADMAILTEHWLTNESYVDVGGLCADGTVNFFDYGAVAAEWRHGKEFTALPVN